MERWPWTTIIQFRAFVMRPSSTTHVTKAPSIIRKIRLSKICSLVLQIIRHPDGQQFPQKKDEGNWLVHKLPSVWVTLISLRQGWKIRATIINAKSWNESSHHSRLCTALMYNMFTQGNTTQHTVFERVHKAAPSDAIPQPTRLS